MKDLIFYHKGNDKPSVLGSFNTVREAKKQMKEHLDYYENLGGYKIVMSDRNKRADIFKKDSNRKTSYCFSYYIEN